LNRTKSKRRLVKPNRSGRIAVSWHKPKVSAGVNCRTSAGVAFRGFRSGRGPLATFDFGDNSSVQMTRARVDDLRNRVYDMCIAIREM
jgi:hypothetical protein